MAIQLDHFLILSVVIFIYGSDVAFGEFSYNLNVFRLAVYGLRMKRPEFYISKVKLIALYCVNYTYAKELENRKNEIPHGHC